MFENLRTLIGQENIDEKTRRCFPADREQAINIVKWAYANKIKTRTVSTDNNWGYNTFIKNDFSGLTINLSKLNRIIDFDDETGCITLEPGVTQGQLKKFLNEKGLNLIAPTTGAGPDCSIIGNILERGYGVTAYFDSFASCMSLEAVWRNGEIYRSPLLNLGGHEVAKLYKWGVGPFFDGLFAQSDYGMCTSMSIVLKRRPSGVLGVMFQLNKSPEFLIPTITKTLQAIGGLMGPIKLTNHHRIVTLLHMAPQLRDLSSPLAQHPAVNQFYTECRIPLWHGFFPLYTDTTLMPSVRDLIARLMDPHVENLHFIEDGALQHPAEGQFIDQITVRQATKLLLWLIFELPSF